MIAYTHYRTDPRCRREATLAASAGWDVHFYALSRGGRPDERREDGITLHELPLDRYRGASSGAYIMSYLRFLWLASRAVTRHHRRASFGIVHVNTMPDFMVGAAQLTRAMGAKVILDIHDVMPELYMSKFGLSASHWKIRLIRAIEVFSARLADAVMTAEHPKHDLLVEHGIPREKITVLLNLPDEALFDRAADRTATKPTSASATSASVGRAPAAARSPGQDGTSAKDIDREFRLVYHGTIAHRLGVDLVVRAMKILEKSHPYLRLQVLGEGDQLPELRRIARELGLGERVTLSGRFQPIEEIIPLLCTSHLGVLATRIDAGTEYMLPTKLIEYLVLGVPSLVVPTRTVRHYFGEENPLYIAGATPEAVANRIAWAVAEYPAVQAATASIRERFMNRYRWETHKQVYLDLLDDLASNRSQT